MNQFRRFRFNRTSLKQVDKISAMIEETQAFYNMTNQLKAAYPRGKLPKILYSDDELKTMIYSSSTNFLLNEYNKYAELFANQYEFLAYLIYCKYNVIVNPAKLELYKLNKMV